ncbi:hypothetical protein TorRG33x02_162610 [Trema orientale]|uniref:Uncharacterized protein n=1 Tax=Trema orientale TaxID=63057 RepID=A0A2P5EQU5_TREOI|nr:hypothetical protein TorRG33x02_162610 [Trema orientale]
MIPLMPNLRKNYVLGREFLIPVRKSKKISKNLSGLSLVQIIMSWFRKSLMHVSSKHARYHVSPRCNRGGDSPIKHQKSGTKIRLPNSIIKPPYDTISKKMRCDEFEAQNVDMINSASLRGLGNPCTLKTLRDLSREVTLNLVFLSKTRLAGGLVEKVKFDVGFSNYFVVNSKGHSRGLL